MMTVSFKIMTLVMMASLAAAETGCQPQGLGEAFDPAYGVRQEKPITHGAFDTSGSAEAPAPVLRAGYRVSLKSASGLDLCVADRIHFLIYEDFTAQVEEALVKCLTVTIDAAKILKVLLTMPPSAPESPSISSDTPSEDSFIDLSDGHFVRVNTLLNATYTPSRPLLPIPFVQDGGKLTKHKDEAKYSVKYLSLEGISQSGSGTITAEILATASEFTPKHMDDMTYDKILHWRVRAEGFQGLNRGQLLLLDELEVYWNLRPISLPRIHLESTLDGLLAGGLLQGQSGDLGGLAGSLVGKLIVDIDIVEEEPVKVQEEP